MKDKKYKDLGNLTIRKKLKKYILLILLLLLISSVLLNHHKKILVSFSSFNEISENLYVDSEIERSKHKKILLLVQDAQKRIIEKFGAFTANPIIIITATSESAKAYGTNDFGSAITLPWGEYVVIGPKGHNVDLIAHELLHAEIGHRLGYLTRELKLPIWLDEGIAMQVDYRKKYDIDIASVEEQEIKRMKAISKRPIFNPHHFWSGSEEQVILNYQLSKALAFELLEEKSFLEILQEIKE